MKFWQQWTTVAAVVVAVMFWTGPVATAADASSPGGDAAATASPAADTGAKADALQQRIDDLQRQVDQLRQQSDVRRKLELTDEEKTSKEKEILTAAGREYTLLQQGVLGFEYNFDYTYYSSDTIRDITDIEPRHNHTLTNSLFTELAAFNNLTLNFNLPFVYKYDRTGTEEEKELTELGDMEVGFQYQPFSSKGGRLAAILFGGYTLPTGRSPYEINTATELSSGSGYPSAKLGVSVSRPIDPILAFGNVSYRYNFDADNLNQARVVSGAFKTLTKVDPGDSISMTLGMGYALSYNASLNLSYQYTYRFAASFHWQDGTTSETGDSTGSMLFIGTGWRTSPTFSINLKVGVGLTNNDPDMTFTLRIPFEFNLKG